MKWWDNLSNENIYIWSWSEFKHSSCSHQKELAEERNLVKAQRRQVEKMKIECDKLAEELSRKEEDNAKFRRKYQLMKQELDEKVKKNKKPFTNAAKL